MQPGEDLGAGRRGTMPRLCDEKELGCLRDEKKACVSGARRTWEKVV